MVQKHRNYREVGDCVVLYADNYINDIEGEKIEELCDVFLERGVRSLVLDFARTDIINSIGVSILVGIIEKIRDKKGDIVFSGLKKTNLEVFDIVGLTSHVKVFDTEDEAARDYSGAAPGARTINPPAV